MIKLSQLSKKLQTKLWNLEGKTYAKLMQYFGMQRAKILSLAQ